MSGDSADIAALLPLPVRKAALHSVIEIIKQHAQSQHSLAGKAAHVLTKVLDHEPQLDKMALKSKVLPASLDHHALHDMLTSVKSSRLLDTCDCMLLDWG